MNTCGGEGVVALAGARGVEAMETLPGRGTSEHLMPAVRRLFAAQGMRVQELAGLGVVVGPGSFTGVRVGLAAAKGLCEGGGVGMVAMSRLGLVAGGQDGLALLDAGRGEFYSGLWSGGAMQWERLLRRAEVEGLLDGGADGVTCEARVRETLGARVRLVREAGAAEMLAEVLRRVEAGEWSDVATTDANYLRRTDAELLVEGR